MKLKLLALLLVSFSTSHSFAEGGIPHHGSTGKPKPTDLAGIEKLLGSTGVEGLIHGAVPESNQYVITYRQGNEIQGVEFPLVTRDATVREQLKKLRRNDIVRVFGKFLGNGAAQHHILVTKLEMVKPWTPGAEPPVVRPDVEIPKDLEKTNVLIGKVHAAVNDGKILVVDYKGAILPVVVEGKLNLMTKGLWPNDKIRLRYEIRTAPGRPSHLAMDGNVAQPLTVLESMKEQSGKQATLTGSLVLFPKSVLTTMEVFAVETIDADGVAQYYFVFASDWDVVKTAYAKLRKIWDSETKSRFTYRTRYVNRKLKVEVKGDVFASALAGNPQILIDSEKAVTQK